MAKTAKKPKKNVDGSPGQRPVLQFRVHADVYETIAKTASVAKRTISEEAAKRLDLALEFEAGLVKIRSDLEALMEDSGQSLASVGAKRIRQSFELEAQARNLQDSLFRKDRLIDKAKEKIRDLEQQIAMLKASDASEVSPTLVAAIEDAVARGIAKVRP